MRFGLRAERAARMLAAFLLGVGLAACAAELPESTETPTFYVSMASATASLDNKMAASMISGFRRNNGLGAVALDKELMRLALEQARAMASRNQLSHNAGGAFPERIRRSSVRASGSASWPNGASSPRRSFPPPAPARPRR